MKSIKERIFELFYERADSDFEDVDSLLTDYRRLLPLSADEQIGIGSYEEAFLVKMTYNSNSIEGSTLTLGDTADVLEGTLLPDKPAKYQFAACGIRDADCFIRRQLSENTSDKLTESLIKDIHERTASDIDPALRGVYRRSQVFIRGSETVPVDPLKVYDLMPTLVNAYNDSSTHPLWKVSAFHMLFENIHPFVDGNGRTGRGIMNWMLLIAGYPEIAIKADAQGSYNQALEAWQVDDNSEPFLKLFKECLREELNQRIAIVQSSREFVKQIDAQQKPNAERSAEK